MKTIRIVFIGIIILLMGLFTGCQKAQDIIGQDTYKEGNNKVGIEVKYESNFILAKDNLDIYIDNHKFYAVENGTTNINKYLLTKGKHTLKVSAGTFHSNAVEFEVKNTGDMFTFSTKNHLNNVELWLTKSFNYYEALGQDIPETNDDSIDLVNNDKSLSILENSSVLEKIWTVCKYILTFIGIFIVFIIVGLIINEVFKAINMQLIAVLIEFFILGIFMIKEKFSLLTILVLIGFVIINIVLLSKLRNVPSEYKKFRVIKEITNVSWAFDLSYICPAICFMFPQLIDVIPFSIHNLNTYLQIYIILCVIYPIFGLDNDLNFPENVKKFINNNEIITPDDIDEYINSIKSSDDSKEDVEKKAKKVFDTLADFVDSGLLKADDENKCYRRIK